MGQDIPGTTVFDGNQAQKGYALNAMCFSFNSAEARAAFLKNEDAYCRKFRLSDEQRAAVRNRDVLAMIAAGGNIYMTIPAELIWTCTTTSRSSGTAIRV